MAMYCLIAPRTEKRDAIGFVVKWLCKDAMTFSERYGGYKRALKIGPLYMRTYARKPTSHRLS